METEKDEKVITIVINLEAYARLLNEQAERCKQGQKKPTVKNLAEEAILRTY